MKKMLITALACLPLSVIAASNNTIQFQGEVTEQTCSVTVNGAEANPTVLLPTVTASALDQAAKVAGMTRFTISLTGCSAPTGSDRAVGMVFVANNLTENGRIGNTGTAKNVTLQLVDPASPGSALDLTGTTAAPGLVLAQGATTASHDFAVQYYAEAAAQAGSVLGSVQYAVTYQ
ncbi:fimbrial protein [Entomohabitans teleogrylli]|uniref:fimbrial protein n=1 Tax=Entomohabitans teleogrylli TaxID=1384589 RepID=UPI00073D6227|nr:fimbrial protein [Entomohabitans teleogrylli]